MILNFVEECCLFNLLGVSMHGRMVIGNPLSNDLIKLEPVDFAPIFRGVEVWGIFYRNLSCSFSSGMGIN
jgi:hypothetical protein